MSNILIINHYARPKKFGGITRHIDFAANLVKRGYKVTIFCANKMHLTNVTQSKKTIIEDGIKFVFINTYDYNGNGIRRFINMLSFLKNSIKESKNRKPFDIVYSSSPHLFSLLAGIRISKKQKSQSIIEVRDLWPETFIQYGIFKEFHPLSLIFRIIEKICYKKADKIITTAPGMYKYICKLNIPKDKIMNINNGVDISSYEYNMRNYDASNIINLGNKFKVLYAGNHGIANNLDDLLKVVKDINDRGFENQFDFIFIGEGSLKDKFIHDVAMQNATNIFIYEALDKKYMPSLYTNVDVLILALKDLPLYAKYGISINKIFDYLYSGTPVVFLGNPLNDTVTDSKGGVTISYDGDYISCVCDEIIAIKNNETQNYDFDYSKKYIKNNYDISILVDKLESLFCEKRNNMI